MSDHITVVSGLPRSGTSLMMQMLTSGGLEPLTDEIRTPDDDNPRGYYELEAVKATLRDASWVEKARGKVVKAVHALIPGLPDTHQYKVVFMRRDLAEVVASQTKMLERSGKAGAKLPPDALKAVLGKQVDDTLKLMASKPNFDYIEVPYADVVADPAGQSAAVNAFLGGSLDENAMAAAVDGSLYRNRGN